MKYYLGILSIITLITLYYFFFKKKESFINYNEYQVRKCFTPKITNNERQSYIKLISITNYILKKYNIDWIPIGGNLLSVYRYKTLILPWDDDFDFVINKNHISKALTILKKELPKYKCKIIPTMKWHTTKSILYKIFFEDSAILENRKIKLKNVVYNWPFLDLFAGSINDTNSTNNNIYNFRSTEMAQDLNIWEYPLKMIECDGIKIKIPTKGFRSYDSFKNKNIIKNCYDDTYIHKHERHIKCIGNIKEKCDNIKKVINFDNI